MMKLYLTTDVYPEGAEYSCYVWLCKPELDEEGMWWHSEMETMHVSFTKKQDLAALGFPPPGGLRTIEIGEYEEGE